MDLGVNRELPSQEDALAKRLKLLREGRGGGERISGPKISAPPLNTDAAAVGPSTSSLSTKDLDGGRVGATFSTLDLGANPDEALPSFLRSSVTSATFGSAGIRKPESVKEEEIASGRYERTTPLTESKSLDERADELLAQLSQENANKSFKKEDLGAQSDHDDGNLGGSWNDTAETKNIISDFKTFMDNHASSISEIYCSGADADGNGDPSAVTDAEAKATEELLAQLMDEVQYEQAEELKLAAETKAFSTTSTLPPPTTNEKPTEFSLPSAPTQLQDPASTDKPSRQTLDFSNDLASRMAALTSINGFNLPSAPTATPTKKTKPAPKKEDIDDWCCVCYSDATIICRDCGSGDEVTFYCSRCWVEGHLGPDAEADERRHRREGYVRGKGW